MGEIELLHPPQILEGKPAHIRKLSPEIGREAFHHGISPASRLLFFHDAPPNVPVEQDKLMIDCAGSRDSSAKDALLQGRKECRVIRGWQRCSQRWISLSSAAELRSNSAKVDLISAPFFLRNSSVS